MTSSENVVESPKPVMNTDKAIVQARRTIFGPLWSESRERWNVVAVSATTNVDIYCVGFIQKFGDMKGPRGVPATRHNIPRPFLL
jgi:hypothetical protein